MKSIFESKNAREAKCKGDKLLAHFSHIPENDLQEILEIIGVVPHPTKDGKVRQLIIMLGVSI